MFFILAHHVSLEAFRYTCWPKFATPSSVVDIFSHRTNSTCHRSRSRHRPCWVRNSRGPTTIARRNRAAWRWQFRRGCECRWHLAARLHSPNTFVIAHRTLFRSSEASLPIASYVPQTQNKCLSLSAAVYSAMDWPMLARATQSSLPLSNGFIPSLLVTVSNKMANHKRATMPNYAPYSPFLVCMYGLAKVSRISS